MASRVANGEMLVRLALVSIAAGALCFASAAPSRAAQVSQSMNVSLTIGAPGGQVTLLVGSLVLTPPAPGMSGGATGSAAIHVNAPAGLPYVITLNGGLHQILNYRRTMLGPRSIEYVLAREDNVFWGDGGPILGGGLSSTGIGADDVYTVLASTAAFGATPPPNGTYTDVVTVAVNF